MKIDELKKIANTLEKHKTGKDYSILIKKLRDMAKASAALSVVFQNANGNAMTQLLNEAADAIEDLMEGNNEA